MTYRASLIPVLALGLACSTTHSTGATASAPSPAGSASTSGDRGDLGAHAGDRLISGRVVAASGDALVINSDDGSQQTLSVVDQTAVTVDGQKAQLSDLHPGQDVRASYSEMDGQYVAVKVESGAGGSLDSSGSLGSGASGASGPDTWGGSGKDAAGSTNRPPGTGSRNDAGQGGTAGTAAPGTAGGPGSATDSSK